MFRLHSILKVPAILAMSLICSGLAAQEFTVAVLKPNGDADETRKQLVVGKFEEVLNSERAQQMGFGIATREQNAMEQTKGEIDTVKNPMFNQEEVTDEGNWSGASLNLITTVNMLDDGVSISCRMNHIKLNKTVATMSRSVKGISTTAIELASMNLMEDILKRANSNLKGGIDNFGKPQNPLDSLEAEITRTLKGYTAVPKWNTSKNEVKVDLTSVKLTRDSAYGGAVTYTVTGGVKIELANNAEVYVPLTRFVESSHELIRKKIMDQIQPKVPGIVKDLISQF